MLLVPLVFYGRSVRAERVGGVPLFCGMCVESREHDVLRLEERATLYGMVEVGDAAISHVSECRICRYVTWVDPSVLDANASTRRRSDLDAFLRAHASVRLVAPWTPYEIGVLVLLMTGALAASYTVHVFVAPGVGCGFFFGLGPAVLLSFLAFTRTRRERHLAAELGPKIERLLTRTGLPMRALGPRARQIGAPHLARLFESHAFDEIGRSGSAYR